MGARFNRLTLLALVSLAFLGAGLFASDKGSAKNEGSRIHKPRARQVAPGFALLDLQGQSHSLSEFHGKPVLLHFFATHCIPCRKELPVLEELRRKYGKQLVVLGVAVENTSASRLRSFRKKFGFQFMVLQDPKGVTAKAYQVRGVPYSYFIGRDGRFSGRIIGAYDWNSSEVISFLVEFLK